MPSDKHMAKGVEVFEATCRDMTRFPEEIIAEALANAEREGMQRAAENDLPKERYPRAFFVLFADEGTNLRKWSSKPFEGATAYVLSEAGEKA